MISKGEDDILYTYPSSEECGSGPVLIYSQSLPRHFLFAIRDFYENQLAVENRGLVVNLTTGLPEKKNG